MPRVASARRAKEPPSSRGAWRLTKISCGKSLTPALLQRRLLLGAGVHRPDPRNDLPQIVGCLDDAAEGRHGSYHDLGLDPLITRLGQIDRTERDQPEQRVVVRTVDPRVVSERHAHAAAASAAMAAIAAEGEVFLVARLSHVADLVVVGVMQSAFRRGFDEVKRGRGVVRLAAFAAARGRACRRGCRFGRSRRLGRGGLSCRSRLSGWSRLSGRSRLLCCRLVGGTGLPGEGSHAGHNYECQNSGGDLVHFWFPCPSWSCC